MFVQGRRVLVQEIRAFVRDRLAFGRTRRVFVWMVFFCIEKAGFLYGDCACSHEEGGCSYSWNRVFAREKRVCRRRGGFLARKAFFFVRENVGFVLERKTGVCTGKMCFCGSKSCFCTTKAGRGAEGFDLRAVAPRLRAGSRAREKGLERTVPHERRLSLVGERTGCGSGRRRKRRGVEGALGIVSKRFVSVYVLVLVFVPFSVRGGARGCR